MALAVNGTVLIASVICIHFIMTRYTLKKDDSMQSLR